MIRICPKCANPIRTGELVELRIIAQYRELRSKVAYSIEKPVDAYADTLEHHECPI